MMCNSMAASNNRIEDYDTVHHILNRIAHQVYFLGDAERDDFVKIFRRCAEYCGIQLLAWCMMTNHFHLMIHLPEPIHVDESEVLRRYGVLKGPYEQAHIESQISIWRTQGAVGEAQIEEWLGRQRCRMYDVGEFMKLAKQWFTEEYNRRNGHVGTLWECAYHDKPVKMTINDMSRRMAYIHLNPIRAAAEAKYGEYRWSSFAAVLRHDKMAEAGLRFTYDDFESSIDELIERHVVLLDELLEYEKRKRAEDIARKRAAGFEAPVDVLTDEAMVAQAAVQLENVFKATEEYRCSQGAKVSRKERRLSDERAVLDLIRLHPTFSGEAIAEAVGFALSTTYKHIKSLREKGFIDRVKGAWVVSKS